MNLFGSYPGMFIRHIQYVLLIHMSDVLALSRAAEGKGTVEA